MPDEIFSLGNLVVALPLTAVIITFGVLARDVALSVGDASGRHRKQHRQRYLCDCGRHGSADD